MYRISSVTDRSYLPIPAITAGTYLLTASPSLAIITTVASAAITYFAHQYISQQRSLEELSKNLDEWVNAAPSGENRARQIAKERIITCQRLQSKTLHLDSLNLTSLPKEIGNLSSLQELDIWNNQLTSLPESFGNLSSLEWLYLSSNQLTSLPDSFGNLSSLQKLYLRNNQLTSLPDSFGNLSSLQELYLDDNQLTSLPDSFGNLSSLQELDLDDNQLTSLPDSFGNLSSLQELDLWNNQLTSLPNSILDLLRGCRVSLGDISSLSERVRTNLQQTTRGPRFDFQMGTYRPGQCECSSEELLAEIYGDETPPALDIPEEKQSVFKSWLNRLSQMMGQSASRQMKANVYASTRKMLGAVATDPEYKILFLEEITFRDATCGDQMALSFIQLGIQRKLRSLQNPLEIQEFLLGTVMPFEHMMTMATQKIPTLRFVDPIEVYLGGVIFLKERLGLELELDTMLYPSCSCWSDKEINHQERVIRGMQADQTQCAAFLITQGTWIGVLRETYPKEMEKADALRENPPEDADYAAIEQQYNAALTTLTQKFFS